jgi:peptide/nickel transport system substrate-binding protein
MSDAVSAARNVCAYVFIPFRFLLPAVICLHASSLKVQNGHPISEGAPEYLVVSGVTGTSGGTLVTSRRSEPKTLNPLTAIDGVSKELIGLLNADLIHINRYTQRTEPALASSWRVSPDGRAFTIYLRRGIRFSDGQPFDADDVLFTFRAYLDEKIHSPQRDLLTIGGKPISISKNGP